MKMVEMAIHSNENFLASTIELDREGKSYTVDTLRELKAEYGQDTELFFIIGADVLIDLPNWRSIREVVKLCKFAAMRRPGFKKDKFNEQKRLLEEEYGAEIEIIDMPLIDISSTDIRNRLAEAMSIKYMLPDDVIEYIEKEGLYL
jgi:nicotinate-nucleotide adenylyltransferase